MRFAFRNRNVPVPLIVREGAYLMGKNVTLSLGALIVIIIIVAIIF
jgi:hypothetical protein